MPPITRRRALVLAGAGLLAACSRSPAGQGAPAGGDPLAPGRPGLGDQPVVEASPTPPPSTAPPMAPGVDPAAVARQHTGQVPDQWGVAVDGVDTQLANPGGATNPTLALTFDACGGPGGSGVDVALLELLEAEAVPATLFLNERWIAANRSLTERLVASPLFEFGNHGSRHLPLSVTGRSAYGIPGTLDAVDAVAEVWSNHEVLTGLLGAPPRWFRSGTAHYDEVAASIAIQLGERPVGFTTNGDYGATATPSQVTAELLGAPAGGIVLAHMNQPAGGTAAGLAAALPVLRQSGVRLVTLSNGGGTRA